MLSGGSSSGGGGGSGSSIFSSAHRDVLDAPIPETITGRCSLRNELKSRGRSAVQAQSWMDALRLYEKALETIVVDHDNNKDDDIIRETSILRSNISLCMGKMNRWIEAVEHAKIACDVDTKYIKGWYRLGQAYASLGEYDDAITAFEHAIQIEPSNKALQKELDKMKQEQKAKEAKAEAASEKKMDEGTTSTSTTTSKSSSSASTPSKAKKTTTTDQTKIKKENTSTTEDESGSFGKSDVVRGYKIVNGKKTSYFHNELSEDAKKLIGNIAPKKIETTTTLAEGGTGDATRNDATTSAWNKAGTWEERDATLWAKESISTCIMEAKYTLPQSSPAPGAIIKVVKVDMGDDNTIHASVASVRGKKRYMYEFAKIVVHWEFRHEVATTTATTKMAWGTLTFIDIDGTCIVGEPYEVSDFMIKDTNESSLRHVLDTFIHREGLRNEIHHSIDSWVQQFRETF